MVKIFIIEDDANILSAMEAKFGLAGIETVSDNGESGLNEILAKLIEEKPDCIILDLIMPNFDGFTMLKTIKFEPDLAKAKVFIFTNLSDADSRARGTELGADNYFIKGELPIDDFVIKIMNITKHQ